MTIQSTSDEGPEVTNQLANWIHDLTLDHVPEEVRERAKHLILDGLTCALVGTHLPGSEKAAHAIFDIEPAGECTVIGWNKKLGPLAAALINSTFVQGFEIDDYHMQAPLHSNSILLPSLFAAIETKSTTQQIDGASFLLATLVGYEVGPRVGLGLYGGLILSRGFHSGPIFGPSAAAAAVSKIFGLSADATEDALGMACTQAGGLMSAQYESDVKRMQHGFAARNGLLAALLARAGYLGIKKVYERPYGGFLATFGDATKDPPYVIDEITKGLGSVWQTESINVKAYAAMAATHPMIDCIIKLQKEHPEKMKELDKIKSIKTEMSEAAFHHGGWELTGPVTAIGAQMNNNYVATVQLVDGAVTPLEFQDKYLSDPRRLELMAKAKCYLNNDLSKLSQKVTIEFDDADNTTLVASVKAPKGVMPIMTNDDIVDKWRTMTEGVIDSGRRDAIEKIVLNLEKVTDIQELLALLKDECLNPLVG